MKPDKFLKTLDKRAAEEAQQALDQQHQALAVQNTQAVIDTIAQAVKTLIRFQATHQPQVSVTNQKLPTSIKTPDFQKIVNALENLKQPLQDNKPDNTTIVQAIEKLNASIANLPTAFPEAPEPVEVVTVKNQPDYRPDFDKLAKAVEKIDVKPVVNIPEDKPDDYTPIIDALSSVVEAVQTIKFPEVAPLDLTPIITATAAVQQSIEALRFPVPNYILPFTDTSGKAAQAPLPLVDKPYDYSGFTNPDANGNYQTIEFKQGGVAGAIVRTLTLAYDASNTITSIERT